MMEFNINPSISNIDEGLFVFSHGVEVVVSLKKGFGTRGVEELFGCVGEDVKWT